MDVKSMVYGYKEELLKRLGKLISINSVEGTPEPDAPFGKGPKVALETALETIDFCKNNNTAYQMPSLLLLVANSCEKFLSKEEIIQYYTEAKTLAKLYGNDVLYLKIKNYLINYDND